MNSITQLARDSANAERIAGRVERVWALVQGKVPPPKPGKPNRRRQLWNRDPRCFWCGRETDIKTANASDSATVEHLYARGRPKREETTRRHLPATLLACRRCNTQRGAPSVAAPDVCPLPAAVKAGKITTNHNQAVKGLRVKSSVKAGKITTNHNQTVNG